MIAQKSGVIVNNSRSIAGLFPYDTGAGATAS